jgi:hypothetical protein
MTTPQLLDWLDGKMAEHGGEKVVPPAPAIAEKLDERLTDRLRVIITGRILEQARIDDQVADARRAIIVPADHDLAAQTDAWLVSNPKQHWTDCVEEMARDLAELEGGAS